MPLAPAYVTQTATTVNSSATTLGTLQINGEAASPISISIENTGGTAFNAFTITRQFRDGGPFVPWISNTDFNTATFTYNASGGLDGSVPQSLPAGSVAWVDCNTGGVAAMQFVASVAAGSTTCIIAGGCNTRI